MTQIGRRFPLGACDFRRPLRTAHKVIDRAIVSAHRETEQQASRTRAIVGGGDFEVVYSRFQIGDPNNFRLHPKRLFFNRLPAVNLDRARVITGEKQLRRGRLLPLESEAVLEQRLRRLFIVSRPNPRRRAVRNTRQI